MENKGLMHKVTALATSARQLPQIIERETCSVVKKRGKGLSIQKETLKFAGNLPKACISH